jgi:hypothetical protein
MEPRSPADDLSTAVHAAPATTKSASPTLSASQLAILAERGEERTADVAPAFDHRPGADGYVRPAG